MQDSVHLSAQEYISDTRSISANADISEENTSFQCEINACDIFESDIP